MTLEWPGGHVSRYEAGWLRERSYNQLTDTSGRAFWQRPAKTWGAAMQGNIPTDTLQNVAMDVYIGCSIYVSDVCQMLTDDTVCARC